MTPQLNKKNKTMIRWYFFWHRISCLLVTKKILFWIFWRWKMWYFLSQNVDGRWYLLITENFLFWTFRRWEIRSFFESRCWWKDGIYWLLKNSCFELFGDGIYNLFFSQKVDGKMIFTWSFWAFNVSRIWEIRFFVQWVPVRTLCN